MSSEGNDVDPGTIDDQASTVRWVESTKTLGPAFRAAADELNRLAEEANGEHPIDRAFAEAMKAEALRMRSLAEIADELPGTAQTQAEQYFNAYFNPRYGSVQREARADVGPAADGQ